MKGTLQKAFGYQGGTMHLPVRDVADAVRFYETALGFRVLSRIDTPHHAAVLARDEVVRVGVRVRLGPGHDALVVSRSGRLGQLTLGLDLQSGTVPQPRLDSRRGTLGRPELEHLPPTAERLPHRAAAVDLLPRHSG